MSEDLLLYRIPGEAIIRQSGSFSLMETNAAPEGFVVSDFLHQRVYAFQPDGGTQVEALHVHAEQPVVISKRDYQIEAQALLHGFAAFGVEKAVYSRVKSVGFELEKAGALFVELEQTYPKAFVYLVSSPLFGTWIGATPEMLIETDGDALKTIALAGTHAIDDASEWTQKEQEEHRFVVDAIRDTLERNECVIDYLDGPKTVEAGPVQHLRTDFKAHLGSAKAWSVAMDLHPTPAVCGTPRMASLDLLLSREMHDRFLYAGIIGLYEQDRSRLFVNLRCAQLQTGKAYLYLGGGYTTDSIPDREWEETENKSRTLLNCMEKI